MWSENISPDYEMDDEFMPEVNDSNLFVLERASDLASIATITTEDGGNDDGDEENSDEVPSELLLPDTIPEIDDENNSTDYENDDDLMPSSPSLVHLLSASNDDDALSRLAEACSSQALANNKDSSSIEFKRRHFKRDSSLSEDNFSRSSSASLSGSFAADSLSDDGLSKGLKFPDYTTVDGRPLPPSTAERSGPSDKDLQQLMMGQMAAEGVLANTSKMLPTLVAGLLKGVLGGGGNSNRQSPPSSSAVSEIIGDSFPNGANALSTTSSYSPPIAESVTMHLQDKIKMPSSGKLELESSSPLKNVISGIEESSDESEFEFVQTEDFR